jgi:HK97 family phage major capsid protein
MSQQLIDKYLEERHGLSSLIDTTLTAAETESRDLSDTEREALEGAKTRMVAIDSQLDLIKGALERRNAAHDLSSVLGGRRNQPGHGDDPAGLHTRTLGSFVDSDAYADWDGSGRSRKATIDVSPMMLTRAVLETGATPGSVLIPESAKYVLPQGAAQTPILDVIGRLPVSTNSVDLVTYGSPTGASGFAAVPEKGDKPEVTLVADSTPVTLETIAGHVVATRQLLQDAPAARSWIDTQLRLGLLHKLEANAAAALAAGTYQTVTGEAGQPLIEVARVGVAKVQEAGFTANAILVPPADAAWFDIYLMQLGSAGAVLGAPVFGLQVVPVPGLTAPLVGNFQLGATMLERVGTEVFITDSHADYFLKNQFVILAEARAKTVVTQPDAIVELEVTPAA